jgi:putative peptidoglycan binding protein/caspase domain-containing protein
MRRARLTIILLGLAFACCDATAGRSEPLRIALVIANGPYANFPATARCAPSAAAARDGLRAKGFEIIERSNLGRGEFDTAIGMLARRVAASPPAIAAFYYCGYAAEFNNRSFLLPVSAVLARDNDVLTQGILVKSVVDSLRRAPDSAGLVVLDVFAPPNAPAGKMGALAEQLPASSFAVVAAGNDGPGDGATAAAVALRDELAEGGASLSGVLAGLRRRLAKEAVTAQFIAATGDAALAAAPPPPPPVAAPAPPVAAPAPPPPKQQTVMVDEDHMTEGDRRQVQTVLANIGYYSGRIDGTFGPETRAAIRRYQFEIKAELTGRLTAEQATRLVNGTR